MRTLAWGEDGLIINGARVILRGACIHHDNGLLGACSFPEAEERRVRILKAQGYNALRSAHNPCSKALLDACDRLGMLMMDEYVDHWYIHKTKYDYVNHFMDWWRQDLKDMADKDFSRVERGYGWPAFWKSDGFRNRVVFRRRYALEEESSFCVFSRAVGFVLAGEKKYPFGQWITCPKGDVLISIHAARIDAFPSVYVAGEAICSNRGWMAEDYAHPPVPAGCSPFFTTPEQDPARWEYSEREYRPVRTQRVGDGVLYEFETELTAVLRVEAPRGRLEGMRICCGESRDEALDPKRCYYSWAPDRSTGETPRCAVRFAFIPGGAVELAAVHQYVDIPVRAAFHCGDPQLNRIWSVAEHTFRLCTGIFFIDGAKRDKWIWAGDAYQSLFVNRYLLADPGVEQRTLLALRGNDPMTGHINTIVDYSLLWLLGGGSGAVRGDPPRICAGRPFYNCLKNPDSQKGIRGLEAMGDNAAVAVLINRLREKIEPDPAKPRYIQTVWGAGRRFRG